jgi:hypothetical protein
MSEILTTHVVTCPACKGTNLRSEITGTLFKKTIYQCLTCGTTLEQSGKGDKATFALTKVGDDYSNADTVLTSEKFNLVELKEKPLAVLTDADLVRFADGDIPDDIFTAAKQQVAIILKKGERVAFAMQNVSFCEERQQKVSSGGGSYSYRIGKGMWFHTGRLSDPKYASVITPVDQGTLYLTTHRYVFVGKFKNIDQPHGKVTSVTLYRDGMGVARSNKQKVEYFKGAYHWPIVASIMLGLVKKAGE